jgi:lysyl-tRNA synthetase class 2
MKIWQKLKQDPLLWKQYFIREQVIKAVRSFFEEKKFHEVETPILIGNPPAESYLDVFQTTLLDRARVGTPAYLSTSPEVSLKKLLVAGIGNCYSLTKSFRNTEMGSNTHNPEFTILEWYRTGAPYTKIMDDCEALILHIHSKLNQTTILDYQGKSFDLTKKWQRISVRDAFRTWAQVDLLKFFTMENARETCKKKGYAVHTSNTWEELYNQIYLNEIEPHLGVETPTIIYEFPGSMAALARKKPGDPRFAERFEFYIAGLELGDCYGELTNWKEQEARFVDELKELKRLGRTTYEYDHDFIASLKEGMPEASGIAVGIDRLVMLFANVTNIADTMFFPIGDLFEK